MILFDTDTCIEILRGNKKIIEKRKLHDGAVAISFMTVAELFYGAEKSGNRDHNFTIIETFLLSVMILDSDIEIERKFGEVKAALRQKDMLLPDADIFIASVALAKCEKLVTGNMKHFSRIPELKLENWIR
jgi:tRNA(fMet)-specific endonuclease VapC